MSKLIKKCSMFLVFVLCLGVMTSCFGSKKTKLTTDQIYEKGVSGIQLPAVQKLSESDIKTLFGLSTANIDEMTIYTSSMNINSTEIGIFKFSAVDAEKDIDVAIDTRLKDLDATWSRYLADQYELVKNVKKFKVGNVKGYIIAEDAAKILENIEKALK